MNSRRKFIIQGGLATTALLAAKPFTAIAKAASPFTSTTTGNSFVLVHTAHMHSCSDADILNFISVQKNNNGAILATAGNKVGTNFHSLQYDITPHAGEEVISDHGEYRIIKKAGVRTGIIIADPAENNVIEKMKSLSEKLKSEKNCQVVVCLSQLGYKNKNSADDISLAAASTHLDIIIGGHPTNFHSSPMILHNKEQAEVIIHSASGLNAGCGRIEIQFDEQGRKKYLELSSRQAS